MAGIRDAMKDILAKLASLHVNNNDGSHIIPYVRVWNNQLEYTRDGKMESFDMPAFFVEIQNQTRYEIIGNGFRDADVTFRIHILHQYQNDGTGVTYEQDLIIFDLRDLVIAHLTYFNATGCGPLTAVLEQQDYNHDNIYHYVIDFICNFTDSKGSKLDESRNVYIDSATPLDIQVTRSNLTGDQSNNIAQHQFLIPKK